MDILEDTLGDHLGSVQELPNGDHVMSDSFGRTLGRVVTHPDGSSTTFDSLHQVIGHSTTLGGTTQHLDALHRPLATEHIFGGRHVFNNPFGQTFMTHDPCTGNLTNGIGQLMGRYRAF